MYFGTLSSYNSEMQSNSLTMADAELIKLLSDDTLLNKLNKKFVSLEKQYVKESNAHLTQIVDKIIDEMKLNDAFFQDTYRNITYGGSFYKGTKISEPMEFDLNVIIKLPLNYNYIQYNLDEPSFTKLYISSLEYDRNLTLQHKRTMNNFIDNNYINQRKFRQWMEGIMTKVMRKLPTVNGKTMLRINENVMYSIKKIKKSGPAFTILIEIPGKGIMCIDVVPVLEFSKPLNASYAYKLSKFTHKTWFAVPKPFDKTNSNEIDLYWRCSFYYQERELLSNYGRAKVIIRLMKKLRDRQQWKSIASYFIEALALNEIETMNDLNRTPLTLLFFMMLNKLHTALKEHKIAFYWDEKYNLLAKIKREETLNIANRLQNIVRSIERQIKYDSFIIAKYILDSSELLELQYPIPLPAYTYIENEDRIQAKEDSKWSCTIH